MFPWVARIILETTAGFLTLKGHHPPVDALIAPTRGVTTRVGGDNHTGFLESLRSDETALPGQGCYFRDPLITAS